MFNLFFILITLLSVLFFYYGTGKDKRVLLFLFFWLLLTGTAAYCSYFENVSAKPPRFLLVLAGAIALSVFFYKIIDKTKVHPAWLLAVHCLRLPVELTLYQLFLQKQVPVLMTFEGWNFDIAVGISAICILAYSLLFKRKPNPYFLLIWNYCGILLLANIVIIAILSSPLPVQQLAFDQPNTAVLQFPFMFLPACIVPLVFLSHLLSIRQLRER